MMIDIEVIKELLKKENQFLDDLERENNYTEYEQIGLRWSRATLKRLVDQLRIIEELIENARD